jgi:hypothetical protein
MTLEDLKLNPELANKLEDKHLENLLAQGIETLDVEQLAISNGLHAIYALAYTNTQINWILNYIKDNPSEHLTNSLNSLYIIKNQCLQMIEESLSYLPNYLTSL